MDRSDALVQGMWLVFVAQGRAVDGWEWEAVKLLGRIRKKLNVWYREEVGR